MGNMRALRAEQGYSLIQVLAYISFASVMALIAVPSLVDTSAALKRRDAMTLLESSIRKARMKATTEGVRGILSTSADGSQINFGYDFEPYNASNLPDQDDFAANLPDGVTITPGNSLFINARGLIVDEFGDLSSDSLSLSYKGQTFGQVNIFPTGAVQWDS